MIAHRLSTIKNVDRILIIEKGRIADMGKHEELLAGNPSYRELYHAFRDKINDLSFFFFFF